MFADSRRENNYLDRRLESSYHCCLADCRYASVLGKRMDLSEQVEETGGAVINTEQN